MLKVTPNPPDTDPVSPYESPDSNKLNEAADLADDVDGSHRSAALALSRMADGVHLLVERALDHLDEPEMAAIFAERQSRAC